MQGRKFLLIFVLSLLFVTVVSDLSEAQEVPGKIPIENLGTIKTSFDGYIFFFVQLDPATSNVIILRDRDYFQLDYAQLRVLDQNFRNKSIEVYFEQFIERTEGDNVIIDILKNQTIKIDFDNEGQGWANVLPSKTSEISVLKITYLDVEFTFTYKTAKENLFVPAITFRELFWINISFALQALAVAIGSQLLGLAVLKKAIKLELSSWMWTLIYSVIFFMLGASQLLLLYQLNIEFARNLFFGAVAVGGLFFAFKVWSPNLKQLLLWKVEIINDGGIKRRKHYNKLVEIVNVDGKDIVILEGFSEFLRRLLYKQRKLVVNATTYDYHDYYDRVYACDYWGKLPSGDFEIKVTSYHRWHSKYIAWELAEREKLEEAVEELEQYVEELKAKDKLEIHRRVARETEALLRGLGAEILPFVDFKEDKELASELEKYGVSIEDLHKDYEAFVNSQVSKSRKSRIKNFLKKKGGD